MGLFTGLLMLPLLPVQGVKWIAEQIADEAELHMYDEDRIRSELLQLELDFEDGLISQEERTLRADELLERLAVARAGRSRPQTDI